jgi:transposase
MRLDTLVKKLKKWRVHNADKTAEKIKELAAASLPPDPDTVAYREKTLAAKVKHLRCLRENVDVEENEMARCLVQTPGFLITSIPGIGVVLGGGIVAEYGDPDQWPHADKMASYAGIVVRQYQTGGPEGRPVAGRLPLDANHHLKDQLLQAAYHTGRHSHRAWRMLNLPGEHRLKEHYRNMELREGCSRLSTAKLILKTARAMIHNQQVYMPLNALTPDHPDAMSPQQYVEYLLIVAEMLKDKWKKYDLTGIPDEDNKLKIWLESVDSLTEHIKNETNR